MCEHQHITYASWYSASPTHIPNSFSLSGPTLLETTTLTRSFSGLNFGGILSHVVRPMMTALRAVEEASGTCMVARRKYAISPLRDQGRPPFLPMPLQGETAAIRVRGRRVVFGDIASEDIFGCANLKEAGRISVYKSSFSGLHFRDATRGDISDCEAAN